MGFIYLYINIYVRVCVCICKRHLNVCPERALAKAESQCQIQNGCADGMGQRFFCGASPLEYIPDGVQSPGCLEMDQLSLSR